MLQGDPGDVRGPEVSEGTEMNPLWIMGKCNKFSFIIFGHLLSTWKRVPGLKRGLRVPVGTDELRGKIMLEAKLLGVRQPHSLLCSRLLALPGQRVRAREHQWKEEGNSLAVQCQVPGFDPWWEVKGLSKCH